AHGPHLCRQQGRVAHVRGSAGPADEEIPCDGHAGFAGLHRHADEPRGYRAQAFPDGCRQGGPDHRARHRLGHPRDRGALAVPHDTGRHRIPAARPGAVGDVARMTVEPDLGPESGLLARLASSRAGRFAITLLRWGIPAALLVIIGRRLTELGWREIWTARPANAGFYVLLVAQFFLQPFGDYLVYRNLWGRPNTPPMVVILRKRLLNTFMLDYSGEAFFYFWAQARLKLKPGLLVHGIKDSNLLSGGAGLVMVYLMLLGLLAVGGLKIPASLNSHGWLYVLVGSV